MSDLELTSFVRSAGSGVISEFFMVAVTLFANVPWPEVPTWPSTICQAQRACSALALSGAELVSDGRLPADGLSGAEAGAETFWYADAGGAISALSAAGDAVNSGGGDESAIRFAVASADFFATALSFNAAV